MWRHVTSESLGTSQQQYERILGALARFGHIHPSLFVSERPFRRATTSPLCSPVTFVPWVCNVPANMKGLAAEFADLVGLVAGHRSG